MHPPPAASTTKTTRDTADAIFDFVRLQARGDDVDVSAPYNGRTTFYSPRSEQRFSWTHRHHPDLLPKIEKGPIEDEPIAYRAKIIH
jgi:hypothetical protein